MMDEVIVPGHDTNKMISWLNFIVVGAVGKITAVKPQTFSASLILGQCRPSNGPCDNTMNFFDNAVTY